MPTLLLLGALVVFVGSALAAVAPPPSLSSFPTSPPDASAVPSLTFNVSNLLASGLASQYTTYGGLSPYQELSFMYNIGASNGNPLNKRTVTVLDASDVALAGNRTVVQLTGFSLLQFERDASGSYDRRVYYPGAGAVFDSNGTRALVFHHAALYMTVSYGDPVGSDVSYSAVGWAAVDRSKSSPDWLAALDPLGCGSLLLSLSAVHVTTTSADGLRALMQGQLTLSGDPLCNQSNPAVGQSCNAASSECTFSGYYSADLGACADASPAPSGTLCSPYSAASAVCDAAMAMCDGQGTCTAAVVAGDGTVCGVAPADQPCVLDLQCISGSCVPHAMPDGLLCRAGNASACLGPAVCASGQCPSTNPTAVNGTVCSVSANTCFYDQQCSAGVCGAPQPKLNKTVCGAPSNTCEWAPQCAFGTCVHIPKANGTLCGDAPNACQWQPKCFNGACTADNKPDGTVCDDGSVLSMNDTCVAGQCVGVSLDCGVGEYLHLGAGACLPCSVCPVDHTPVASCTAVSDTVCALATGRLHSATLNLVENLLDAAFQGQVLLAPNTAMRYHPTVAPELGAFKVPLPRLLSAQLSLQAALTPSVATDATRREALLTALTGFLATADVVYEFGLSELAAVNWTAAAGALRASLVPLPTALIDSTSTLLAAVNASVTAAANPTNATRFAEEVSAWLLSTRYVVDSTRLDTLHPLDMSLAATDLSAVADDATAEVQYSFSQGKMVWQSSSRDGQTVYSLSLQ